MNIWMFSSGDSETNAKVDPYFIGSLRKKNIKAAFIPTSNEEAADYYDEFIDRVSLYSYASFSLIDLEKGLTKNERTQLFENDLIYISGGNTYSLLHYLKKNKLLKELRNYAESGGCLAGHSAGAIVMSPNINTAAFPPEDCDDNTIGLMNFNSMNSVDFEIFPHYENLSFYKNSIRLYSRLLRRPLYGIEDGSAIHLEQTGISFFGNVTAFVKGKIVQISTDRLSR